ncbi:MAG: DUF1289 domain-containing protein [Burkholderiales bacterium]|nr:MAG: DUF1289 domain-containing protein [Burkholderiales bacterium]
MQGSRSSRPGRQQPDAAADANPLRAAARPVPSPCISVCRIEPTSGLCEGCLRTIDEIADWGSLGDDAKRAIWSAIEQRRQARAAALAQAAQRPGTPR